MFRHLYDTPTEALRLVSNEGRLKRLLLQYKWLKKPYLSQSSLAITGYGYIVIFHPYDIPTFKTKARRLVSNEGRVKRPLPLYKRVIQPYLSLLWL